VRKPNYGLSVLSGKPQAGAKCIDVTVNGLGERAGLASLATTTAALSLLYEVKKWDLTLLPKISKMVEKYAGVSLPLRQPIVGEDVFTHKGGLHAIAVLENPDVYEILHPEAVGKTRKIVIGSYTSKKVLAEYFKSINPLITDQEIDNAYKRLKHAKQHDIIWEIN
jgi:isopropylmalate/homocitrate/citramalate synthase